MLLLAFPGRLPATGLLLEDLRLHLPWVTYRGVTFFADLAYVPGGSAISFSLTGAGLRTVTPPSGAAAVLNEDFSLQVPLLGFLGELFSLDLQYRPDIDATRFVVSGVSLAAAPAGRGNLVSSEQLSSLTASAVAAQLLSAGIPFVPKHGVTLYRLIYDSIDPFNRPTRASGLLAVPAGLSLPAPLLAYQHGSMTRRDEAPSASGMDVPTLVAAASGYLTATADYLGLGLSGGLHPYVHAKSLSSAVVDMLRASRAFCSKEGIGLSGQLFLAGYSEGGYATMAVHRELETHHASEFDITASAPAAGPYDLSMTMLKQGLAAESWPNPYYFPYILLAYNTIYGLADDYDELFAAPYDDSIPGLYDGGKSGAEINAQLPAAPRDAISAALIEALEGAEPHPLKSALRENDLYQWTPRAAMRMFHCRGDQDVPFANSTVAHNYFQTHGASHVELVALDFGGHVECSIPTLVQIKTWFDTLLR